MPQQPDNEDKPAPKKRKAQARKKEDDESSLIAASIRAYLEEYKERKKLNNDNIEIVASILEEYLDSFLLIGYNYEGESITYSHAKTQAQVDSLNTGIFRFINQHAVKPPQMGGYGPVDR